MSFLQQTTATTTVKADTMTHREAITASLDVDSTERLDDKLAQDGLKPYLGYNTHNKDYGYYGIAYYKEEDDGSVKIIIAHRGTVNRAGWYQDLMMWLLGVVPLQYQYAAVPFCQQVISDVTKDSSFAGKPIRFHMTGHSLGATLAELVTATLPNNVTSAITFDSPGSAWLLRRLVNEGMLTSSAHKDLYQRLQTMSSDVDAINSCMGHDVNEIVVIPPDYTRLDSDQSTPFYLGVHDWAMYSFKVLHSIRHFWNYLHDSKIPESDKYKNRVPIANWPLRPIPGYKQFMNYSLPNIPFHKDFWDQYISNLWGENPDMRPYFKNDFNWFRDYYIQEILRHDYYSKESVPEFANVIKQLLFKAIAEATIPAIAQAIVAIVVELLRFVSALIAESAWDVRFPQLQAYWREYTADNPEKSQKLQEFLGRLKPDNPIDTECELLRDLQELPMPAQTQHGVYCTEPERDFLTHAQIKLRLEARMEQQGSLNEAERALLQTIYRAEADHGVQHQATLSI